MKDLSIKTRRIAKAIIFMVLMSCFTSYAFAASNYGEDQPLKSTKKETLYSSFAGHNHEFIEASNGCRYLVYHSCMDSLVGTPVTNHSEYVTIDGVKYSLCNYNKKTGGTQFAAVIKKVGTTSGSTSNTGNNTTSTPSNSTSNSSKPVSTNKTIALQKISLNYTSLNFIPYDRSGKRLTVTYVPSNTTVSKTVSWKSSNTSVAVVSKDGVVGAKKAGTATITATCNGKTATCKVTVKDKESYKNVSEAYTVLNKFRTTKSNQWYWNANNKTKTYTYGLKALKRDATLEKIAKQRAKEQWTRYYVQGKSDHTRPNGKSCWTAYSKNSKYCGECLHWWDASIKKVITDPNNGWAETNLKYKGQGHRRLMLMKKATRVGIACYEKNGKKCWALCLGY